MGKNKEEEDISKSVQITKRSNLILNNILRYIN